MTTRDQASAVYRGAIEMLLRGHLPLVAQVAALDAYADAVRAHTLMDIAAPERIAFFVGRGAGYLARARTSAVSPELYGWPPLEVAS